MSNFLNEKIDTPKRDGLIVDNFPPADVFSVTLRAVDKAVNLERGTVLALSTGTAGDKKMVVLGTEAATNETLEANCILCDDTEVGTADVIGLAYRTGHFARNQLIAAESYKLTKTDEEALRKGGILLSDAMNY
ncbi:MAG: head decoration protein [Clostridiales Family XIII bacterium]|nr:head decoration protein [Clostridia bacterium]MDY3011443.1 head decoration protein [Clostridiales Family XIII bacterium]MDY4602102.1 hypothetical protein [Bacteroides uniformis]